MVRAGRKKTATMQPMGNATPFAPKKRSFTEDNPDLEVSGADASQDFTGLTGAEQHFDNLLQSAYEADLHGYGFNP